MPRMHARISIDAAYAVTGGSDRRVTVTDRHSGISARGYSCGNFGDSFLLAVDADASEWTFGAIAPGMYEIPADEWMREPKCDCTDCLDRADAAGMADAIEYVTEHSDTEGSDYLRGKLRDDLPFGRGSED